MNGGQDHYKFHLILKGLCRCVSDKERGSLNILLVDARSPRRSRITGEPLRDHRAVIEFRLRDWRNRTSEPLRNFVEINKRNKGEVGLYLLDLQDVRIGVSDGELSPPLEFIEHGSNSFRKIPHLDTIEPGTGEVLSAALRTGENCIARVLDLNWGRVGSERLSARGGTPVKWAFSRPRSVDEIGRLTPEDQQFIQELAAAKEINLDVRVTMQVPKRASVLVDANPFAGTGAIDPPAFMLRPEEGQDLEVWVKNRELEVILTESDELGQEAGCLSNQIVDFDFELHYELSARPNNRRVPYRPVFFTNGPITAGGCACGVCT